MGNNAPIIVPTKQDWVIATNPGETSTVKEVNIFDAANMTPMIMFWQKYTPGTPPNATLQDACLLKTKGGYYRMGYWDKNMGEWLYPAGKIEVEWYAVITNPDKESSENV